MQCLSLSLLLLISTASFSMSITNTSSLGIIAAQEQSDDNSSGDLYSSVSQSMNWDESRTSQDHSGSLSLTLISDANESSRTLDLNDRYIKRLRRITGSLALDTRLNESLGLGYLSLNDQFERMQSLQNINTNEELISTQLGGTFGLAFNPTQRNQMRYVLRRELNHNRILSEIPRKQSIDLTSHFAETFISLTPFLGLAFSGNYARLNLTAEDANFILDSQQIERTYEAMMVFQLTKLSLFSVGAYAQIVDIEGDSIIAEGPQFRFSHRLSRRTEIRLSSGLLRVRYLDGERESFTSSNVSLNHRFSNTRQISMAYRRRLENTSDIYNLLATRGENLGRVGFISESSSLDYGHEWSRFSHELRLSHTHLFIERDVLTFTESRGETSLGLRAGKDSLLNTRLSYRHQQDFILDQEPVSSILGLGFGYQVANLLAKTFAAKGSISATIQWERQQQGNQSQIRRASASLNTSLIF